MDDCPELLLKKLCCTCLSQDRKLSQLCRLTEGVNNLYLLLSYDTEAYREGFFKDTGHWFICWECWALMRRISRFRSQACVAQRHLADLLDGRTELKFIKTCLSRLSQSHKVTYDQTVAEPDDSDNFVDCGPDIKAESDEDVPLSELHSNYLEDNRHNSEDDTIAQDIDKVSSLEIQPVYKKRKKSSTKKSKKDKSAKKNKPKDDDSEDQFTTIEMNEEEMVEFRNKMRMVASFADAKFKCESCIEGFKSQIEFDKHVSDLHTEKPDHVQCDICLTYVCASGVGEHRAGHRRWLRCRCGAATRPEWRHLHAHAGGKGFRKTPRVLKPGSKPRRNPTMLDKRTPFGYKCAECDKYFENKNLRWKHVQRHHREGYKCSTCEKRFAFKNNLARHELTHQGPPPRQECPHCRKQVRVDLLAVHLRIHSRRQRYACAECDKRFASKASYEHHLKYTAKHAAKTPNKYKCTMCDKAYRSRGELRDHSNYQHLGTTQHKCPICDKGLATRRCVTRHVRRAHLGVRERARDHVCQLCGKAFRDKKTLREHELIHTGERPLSCEVCGGSFRQSASLYTHRRRVHRLRPRPRVTLVQAADAPARDDAARGE